LVLAGGVALNCVGNGRILRESPFEKIWIQPAAGDAGGALGAALFVWYQLLDHERVTKPSDLQKGSLLGPAFDNDSIKRFLDDTKTPYHTCNDEDDLAQCVADLIASNKVVGWFQGAMEFGPRALGHRSILGDARSESMQSVMNLKIKFRESFRPFAPCVLAEHAHEYFDIQPDQDSPYMLIVAPVKEDKRLVHDNDRMQGLDRVKTARSVIPAVTHVDNSARVQTVDEGRHPRLHRLMTKLYQATGCPVIINTSFNIRGEPIVCTPEQAYRCFMATDMDALVLENQVLYKQEQPGPGAADVDQYKSQFKLD
ncbi:MAG: hypothetical protein HQ515_00860, partial [Phycisphaeraceae bacterium]|nr:hypothetical protein [Phycisphaeraceae bacterium]